jgi:hypothetical protein
MFEHSIHDGKQLAHAGGDNDLGGFSSLREQQFTIVDSAHGKEFNSRVSSGFLGAVLLKRR